MDIHKPKAAHSIREFLIEIGTIICGILIALGLEQGIEAVHHREISREAREAIRSEIGWNLEIFRRRAQIQSCIDARLLELEHLIVSTPLGAKLPRPLWVGRPQTWSIREGRWNAATSSGRTALLPAEEQASYGGFHTAFQDLQDEQRVEQLAWADLRTLETLPELDAAARLQLIQALHRARYANFRVKVANVQITARAREVGLAPADWKNTSGGSRSVCIPMNTTREAAIKQTVPGRTAIAEP